MAPAASLLPWGETLRAMPEQHATSAPDPARAGGKRALVILASVARVAIGLALIAGMLILLPGTFGGTIYGPIALGLVGAALFAAYFAYQLRLIRRAANPTIRSAESLVLVAALFLALYSSIYVVISKGDPASFSEPLDDFSAYYFALTVLATVGFGDITPVSTPARAVTMTQMALDIAFVGVAVRVLGGAARDALALRSRIGQDASTEPVASREARRTETPG